MTEKRYEELVEELKKYDRLAVAFSGGVDSTLLLKAAYDALGENVVAMTVSSEFTPKSEVEEAKNIAKEIGAKHIIVHLDILTVPEIRKNPKDRCYHCKSAVLSAMLEEAEKLKISTLAEGTNADDVDEYRPGFKAVQEYGAISPLLSVKLTKKEIREILKYLNCSNWNKPAMACLASRIPYGEEITASALNKIFQAETMLSSLGYEGVRLRLHHSIARIEIREEDFEKFMTNRKRIVYSLKSLGLPFIALDLEGYRRGSFDEEPDPKNKK